MGRNDMSIMDGLRNIVANLGTDRDKAAHSHYYNRSEERRVGKECV